MTTPDPKPLKAVKDRYVFVLFHDQKPSCLACTNQPGFKVDAHHLISRAQGGDDVLNNLIPLCVSCHRAYHNGNQAARRSVARFLRSDAGSDHCAYLISKLGPFAAEGWVLRLEGRLHSV